MNNSLFKDIPDEPKKENHLKVIPVSVIDVEAQKKRRLENHSKVSSRANYSPFPEEISDLCYEFFLRGCDRIVDPFAGWGERHSKAVQYGKNYVGFDTSTVAIEKAKAEYNVQNTLADSMTVDIPRFNRMITCPPYWNLEKYDSEIGIDRVRTYYGFVESLREIFRRFYRAAEDGTTFCVMVGDWRKNHVYYNLEYQVSKIFDELGSTIVDKIVVSRKKVSKIKIMLPQAKRLGYTVRVHENLLVFRKEEND